LDRSDSETRLKQMRPVAATAGQADRTIPEQMRPVAATAGQADRTIPEQMRPVAATAGQADRAIPEQMRPVAATAVEADRTIPEQMRPVAATGVQADRAIPEPSPPPGNRPDTPDSQIIESAEEDENPEDFKPVKDNPSLLYRTIMAETACSPNSISYSDGGSWIGSPAGLHYTLSPRPALTPLEQSLLDDMERPGRRHKPVPRGFVTKLDKGLRMARSTKLIYRHQVRDEARKQVTTLEITVNTVQVCAGIVTVRGSGDDQVSLKIVMNTEFCTQPLDVGSRIRISPPWFSLDVAEEKTLVGVTSWEIIKHTKSRESKATATGDAAQPVSDRLQGGGEGHSKPVETSNATADPKSYDARCECELQGDSLGFCDDQDLGIFCSLAQYPGNGGGQSRGGGGGNLKITESLHNFHSRQVGTALELVDRFGGSCASPQDQSNLNKLPILVVKILQPIFRVRFYPINRETQEIFKEVEICFLCEDEEGNFVFVKLDTDLFKEPREWAPMLEGNWNKQLGSRVKISGLFPDNRTVTNRSLRLYSLCLQYRKPTQRYYCKLRAYPCSRMKVLSEPTSVPELPGLDAVVAVIRPPFNPFASRPVYVVEKRCNVQCVVVYRDDVNHHLYVHDVHRPDQSQYTLQVIKYTKDTLLPEAGMLPRQVRLYGVWREGEDLQLDHYSACVKEAVNVNQGRPYTSLVHLFSKDTDHQLVRLQGQVSEIKVDECEEWISCAECGDDIILVMTEEPDECSKCHATNIRNNLVVVVKVCGVWALLAEPTAYSLLGRSPPLCQGELPEKENEGTDPGLVIGQHLDIVCIVQEPKYLQINPYQDTPPVLQP